MTDREKIIEIITPFVSAYGEDEAIADALISAGIGDVTKWKERAEKDLERYKRALCCACKASAAVLTKELVKARVDCFLQQAEREIEEEGKDG